MSVRHIPAQVEWSCSTCVATRTEDVVARLQATTIFDPTNQYLTQPERPDVPVGWSRIAYARLPGSTKPDHRVWHLCPACSDSFEKRMLADARRAGRIE